MIALVKKGTVLGGKKGATELFLIKDGRRRLKKASGEQLWGVLGVASYFAGREKTTSGNGA